MKTCGVGHTFLGDREFDSLRSLLRLDDVETKKISFGGEDTFANPRIEFDAKFHLKYKMVFYTLFVT